MPCRRSSKRRQALTNKHARADAAAEQHRHRSSGGRAIPAATVVQAAEACLSAEAAIATLAWPMALQQASLMQAAHHRVRTACA